jgi:hypothetical protein
MASSGGEGDSDNDDYEYAYSSGDEDDDDMNNNYAVDDDDRMDISNSGMKVQLDKKPSVNCATDNPNAAPTSTSFRGMYKTLDTTLISALQLDVKDSRSKRTDLR